MLFTIKLLKNNVKYRQVHCIRFQRTYQEPNRLQIKENEKMEVKRTWSENLMLKKKEVEMLTGIVLRTEGLTQEEEDFIDIFIEYSEKLGGERDEDINCI